ncbi:hypothetical protein [Luteitalea sp.]|jgi:hypothetical protein|uniref:hypothetical protein n=1 Tax=Luteitalea sp. TaxID=2004800 RepID=UPI0037CA1B8D
MPPTPDARQRLLALFREMPGHRLTAAQAARLCGLDHESCTSTLRALVADGLLRVVGAHYLVVE